MKSTLVATALVFMPLAGLAEAAGVIEVASNPSANVYLDGDLIGFTPLTVSGIPAGSHQIQIENPADGETKNFIFNAPRGVSVSKYLEADFVTAVADDDRERWGRDSYRHYDRRYDRGNGRGQRWSQGRGRGRGRGHDRQVSYEQPVVVEHLSHRSGAERAKVHTRNTLLGLTVASQLLGGDRRDRKRFRNVGLGLTLLNEIAR